MKREQKIRFEYQARLGGSEGRVRALDAQLSQMETAKKEVEQKLSSVGSTLRRIAGIQMDGSVNMPFKLMSPSRRWSPARGKISSYFDLRQQDYRLVCNMYRYFN